MTDVSVPNVVLTQGLPVLKEEFKVISSYSQGIELALETEEEEEEEAGDDDRKMLRC